MDVRFRPMDEGAARVVLTWRYPPPYDLYNSDPADLSANLRGLLDPANHYFAATDATGALIGSWCYGPDARVPGGDYAAPALDVGLGLRPDLTGKGLGEGFVRAVLAFGEATFAPPCFRLTVASFNERAIRVYERAGFRVVAAFPFAGVPDGRAFLIMMREGAAVAVRG